MKVEFSRQFPKNSQISNSMRTDGQTDKYNEAKSRFSQFCEKRLKTQLSETWHWQDIFIFKLPGAHTAL